MYKMLQVNKRTKTKLRSARVHSLTNPRDALHHGERDADK